MLAKDVKRGEMIRKVFDLGEVKDYSYKDPDTGEVVLRQKFIITSNRRDRDRDIVDPSGAMTDDYANNPVVLWAHQYTELPLARSIEMERIKQASVDKDVNTVENHSITALVTYVPDSIYQKNWTGMTGSMVYGMYKAGFLNAVSIGFDPWEYVPIEEKDLNKTPSELLDLMAAGGTKFTKWDMLEFSFVPVPSNPSALVDRKMKKEMTKMLRTWATNTLVECEKCASTPTKGAIPYAQTPKDDQASWDGPGEVAKATPEQLRKMCAWFDSAAPEVKSSYKLPHHTTAGTLIKAGLMAAGGAVQGARSPPNIPPGDMPGVKSHLAKHYKEFDMTAPWESQAPKAGLGLGGIVKMAEELKATIKQGRALSAKNEADIGKANDLSDQIGELLEGVLESVTGKPVPEPADTGSDVKPSAAPKPASYGPIITASYPLGHDVADILKNIKTEDSGIIGITKADDVVPLVDTREDGENSGIPKIDEELFSVDQELLAEVLGIDLETLESLTAQGEEGETLDETTEE